MSSNLSHRPSHKDGNLSHRPSHKDGNLSHRPSHAGVDYMKKSEDEEEDLSFQNNFWTPKPLPPDKISTEEKYREDARDQKDQKGR